MSILSILGLIERVVDNVIPDPEEKMKMKIELAKLADAESQREHEQLVAQSEVNKVEAGHRSIFVAGWRPAIGWGCGAALVYNTLIAPATGLGVADLGFLQTVLMGMLGLAGMRSFDKVKGTANDILPILKPKDNETVAQPLSTVKKKKNKGLEKLWPF